VAQHDWPGYLAAFHAERAGITEDVLEHAVDAAGATPYDWAARAVLDASADGDLVVDLACGSAPMAGRLPGRRYLGLDLSTAELFAARAAGAQVGRADAARLPVRTGSADAVVMSMALMLVPLGRTLGEVARVLRPGGAFVATVPHNRPMPRTDWLRYARLCLSLRHAGLSYPNGAALRRPSERFAAAGLRLDDDQQVGFVCDIADERIAEQLLASLYLPEVTPERLAAGRRVVMRWVGSTLTTPLRRLVARA